jgi:hypothetical protein
MIFAYGRVDDSRPESRVTRVARLPGNLRLVNDVLVHVPTVEAGVRLLSWREGKTNEQVVQ